MPMFRQTGFIRRRFHDGQYPRVWMEPEKAQATLGEGSQVDDETKQQLPRLSPPPRRPPEQHRGWGKYLLMILAMRPRHWKTRVCW